MRRWVAMMSEMAAGLELDAMIAERVMGWRCLGSYWVDRDGNTRTLELTSFGSFQPSQDWAAMGVLVAHLHSQGWVVVMTQDNGTGCYCQVWYMGDDGRPVEHRVETTTTLPHAVALAALRAVGGGGDGR